MTVESIVLQGRYIRLEPLQPSHAEVVFPLTPIGTLVTVE